MVNKKAVLSQGNRAMLQPVVLIPGAIASPIKYRGRTIFSPSQSSSRFLGFSMPRMCLRPGSGLDPAGELTTLSQTPCSWQRGSLLPSQWHHFVVRFQPRFSAPWVLWTHVSCLQIKFRPLKVNVDWSPWLQCSFDAISENACKRTVIHDYNFIANILWVYIHWNCSAGLQKIDVLLCNGARSCRLRSSKVVDIIVVTNVAKKLKTFANPFL